MDGYFAITCTFLCSPKNFGGSIKSPPCPYIFYFFFLSYQFLVESLKTWFRRMAAFLSYCILNKFCLWLHRSENQSNFYLHSVDKCVLFGYCCCRTASFCGIAMHMLLVALVLHDPAVGVAAITVCAILVVI